MPLFTGLGRLALNKHWISLLLIGLAMFACASWGRTDDVKDDKKPIESAAKDEAKKAHDELVAKMDDAKIKGDTPG